MAEPTLTEAGVVAAGVSAFVGWLMKFFVSREVSRVDDTLKGHNERLRQVEASTSQSEVMLDGLRHAIARLEGTNDAQHRERMDELRRVHERIDQVFDRMK